MRIALISAFVPPEAPFGAHAYAADLAESLAHEHQVVMLTSSTDSAATVETVRLPRLLTFDPSGSPAYKSVWHLADQWRPSVHRAVSRALRAFDPQVVHTHSVQGVSAAPFTAIDRCALPHVHTAHDFNLLCVRVTMTREGRYCGGRCATCRIQRAVRGRAIARRLDWLIAPSDYVRERHVAAGVVDSWRASTVRQGAKPGRVRVRRPAAEQITLGYIGALSPHKGVATLLRAMHAAPQGWRLRVAGDGPLAGEVRTAEADPRIEYVGFVKGAAKEGFFEGLDLLVVPSEWEENAPLALAESAVRALPAVVSDRGGLPELPGVRTFGAGDAEGLVRAVASFVENGALARESEALAASKEAFSWSTHVRAVEEVLTRVAR